MMRRLSPVFFIILTLLTGCSTQPRSGNTLGHTPLEQQQEQLRRIYTWQIDGKLGVRSPYESGTASLKWQQFPRAYNIHISGPLGHKRMQVQGEDGKVSLHRSGQPSISADNAEELLLQATGWGLPVSQLSYWVRGLPAPGAPVDKLETDANGLVNHLQQQGWDITYLAYTPQAYLDSQLLMPSRIQAVNNELRLTLVIRNWQLGNSRP